MKHLLALSFFLSIGTSHAEQNYPAQAFASDLTCATKQAAAVANAGSDGYRVRRAVDRCMGTNLPIKQVVAHSSSSRLVDLEYRRETLIMATMERLQLCRNTGIGSHEFASRCPRLFTLEAQ